ncbi:hypothetical protein BASA50_005604 [Batrachochytrium salamandrivorans]|uniref:UV-stimulated scaffold protein A C-terminal domain-containing protein n=1 Tax=Batrachochytrium salamandrivorans TaxID=1357716 RepID=A0ABQ8FCA4_9FUNG|nr:hypothetical protein BASA62_008642 [Batrachochytrium salamandrivorans]KAH6584167.1 hypothetical protein BASA61_007637 [Batrachochytrium salamandrivorans]KAH6585184.1 hypothetical protein BASA60_000654 [Batrachochytrium salamandrivorans]KAH6595768.1 hypothetical protein BASA50_005604 [Batrachochytrium salamandrivorans]
MKRQARWSTSNHIGHTGSGGSMLPHTPTLLDSQDTRVTGNDLVKTITKLLTSGEDQLEPTKLKVDFEAYEQCPIRWNDEQCSNSFTNQTKSNQLSYIHFATQAIKVYCKASDANINTAFKTIFRLMNRKHSQIRFACVQLCNELMLRSAHFRFLLLEQLDPFLSLCFGDDKIPVPPPAEWANRLKVLAASCISQWHLKFSAVFGQLLVAIQVAQPFLENNSAGSQESQVLPPISTINRQQERTKQLRLEKYHQIRTNFSQISARTQCLEMMMPSLDEHPLDDIDKFDSSQTKSPPETYKQSIQSYGLGSNSYSLQVTVPRVGFAVESFENKALFDTLRECSSLLRNKHLPQISLWIDIVTKAEDPDKREHEAFLKKIIDMKWSALNNLEKTKDLLQFSKTSDDEPHSANHTTQNTYNFIETENELEENGDDDDEEFFEVPPNPDISEQLPSVEVGSSTQDTHPSSVTLGYSLPNSLRIEHSEADPEMIVESTSKDECSSMDTGLKSLFEIAPEVPYGSDLDFWDKKAVPFSTLSSHAGIDYHHRFLGDSSSDRIVSEDAMASLRKRNVYLTTAPPTDIQACRAPLKNGTLCPRRDLIRCPIHGRIITRDDMGTPINHEDTIVEPTEATESARASSVSRAPSRRNDKRLPRDGSAWQLIEADVDKAFRLLPSRPKRESKLVDLTKKPNPIQHRISKRLAKLSKASVCNHPDDAELLAKVQDRNVNRW